MQLHESSDGAERWVVEAALFGGNTLTAHFAVEDDVGDLIRLVARLVQLQVDGTDVLTNLREQALSFELR